MKKSFVLPVLALSAAFLSMTSCDKQLVDKVDLIPQAQSVSIGKGGFLLKELAGIKCPQNWTEIAQRFADDVKEFTGNSISVSDIDAPLILQQNDKLTPGAYSLNLEKGRITIQASDNNGISNGLTTLRQIIMTTQGENAESEVSKELKGKLPVLTIEDQPRFGYRGLMIDCSRHFWSVDELKETIRQMAFFKLNYLHLHLTDNNGWRLAMEKYPELTEAGTFYKDFPELSGRYYSKSELKDLVKYAASYGVEIIPEVDLPGHSTALLAAMPQLSCNGGKFEAYPEEQPLNERKRGNENMICIGNPESLKFTEDIINELVDIFPSKYIHLGGDEVPTNIWQKCPKCQSLFKKEGMKEPGEIQDYYTRKVSEIVRSKGKTMIGWDEINERHAATKDDVLTVWRDNGIKQQKEAVERGIKVIMCPQHGCYYDWGYAGNSTRKVYEWDPVPADFTADEAALVLGGQGALWTERIATQDRVEWMLYPRLTALAEVLWTKPELRNWDDFYSRITGYYPIMKELGINFYEDDALNEKEFVPTDEKPALIRPASIDTNIPLNPPYHPEYAFDGKTNSFFWGGTSIGPKHYFKIVFTEPAPVSSVEVITGDSKDYITMADLLVSEDGNEFKKIGEFNSLGEAKGETGCERIKAVMIQVTGQHTCWPIIKEIILK